MTAPRTVRLVLEYDGSDLSGWQRQENAPSVQGHLEEALARMTGVPTPVIGASRTDAGVHALGQVACFDTAASIPCDGFRLGLNSMLPPAIAVVAADEAPPGFHARFWASGKHYRYSLLTRSSRSPLARRLAWHRPGAALDLAAMRQAAELVVGERDFSAFRASGCTARTAVRRIDQIAISEPHPHRIDLDVRGNAFLRNMVRILVGTLVEVGERRLPPTQVAEILESRDRTRAGQTAPPHGLCLVEVLYAPRTG